jgi:hypothetical protein
VDGPVLAWNGSGGLLPQTFQNGYTNCPRRLLDFAKQDGMHHPIGGVGALHLLGDEPYPIIVLQALTSATSSR